MPQAQIHLRSQIPPSDIRRVSDSAAQSPEPVGHLRRSRWANILEMIAGAMVIVGVLHMVAVQVIDGLRPMLSLGFAAIVSGAIATGIADRFGRSSHAE